MSVWWKGWASYLSIALSLTSCAHGWKPVQMWLRHAVINNRIKLFCLEFDDYHDSLVSVLTDCIFVEFAAVDSDLDSIYIFNDDILNYMWHQIKNYYNTPTCHLTLRT